MNKLKLRLMNIYHHVFGERFYKKIDYNFPENLMRWDLVNNAIQQENYETYLEIGCDDDMLFSKVNYVKKKIGVDPVRGGNCRKTSDEFFLQNKENFDCIFIDGLHEYQQVKKDINNSLNTLNENGTIFIHDCLPTSFFQQAVPRCRMIWTGDVWKSIVEMRTLKNLDTSVCKIDHGIAIIKKRENSNKLTIDIEKFSQLRFKDYYNNYSKYMRLIDHKEALKFLKK